MKPWFTVEQIDAATFAISEYQHWEETHCYLLCGTARALLIDTGLGVANIRAVADRLTSLPITVVTTHVHWDHIGGHRYFEHIAVHEAERDWLAVKFPIPLQAVKKNLLCRPCAFPADFVCDNVQIYQGEPQRIFRDGDVFDLGRRQVVAVHTPGHSPGHCCFYEPKRETLYSGDLIYSGCLDAFYPTTDPELFLQSVRKIQSLAVSHVFPAHHQLHIPVDLIDRVERGFSTLEENGKLIQGSGVFDFGEFQIHL